MVEGSIENKIFKSCNHRILRPDTGFLEYLEIIQSPILSKPVVIKDPSGRDVLHIFVSRDWQKGLTPQESKLYRNKIPTWSSKKIDQVLTKILTKRILNSESIDSLVVRGKKGWKCYFTTNLWLLQHAIGCALAVYHGLLTHIGQQPTHAATAFKRGRVTFRGTSRNYPILTLLSHFLRVFPKDVSETTLVKLIKLSFCGNFSQKTDQELPEDYLEKGFPLMPKFMECYILKNHCPNYEDIVQLYFTLQQSKGLCQSVPDSFLKEGLEKHRKGLVRDPSDLIPRDDELYEKLKEFSSRMLGEYVKENYDPFKGFIPNTNSCLEKSRSQDGALGALTERKQIQRGINPLALNPRVRMEPYVIGLFGSPGVGKSTLIRSIIGSLSQRLFSNCPIEDLLYSRSCATEHWDGYTNQPIVILDDWAQSAGSYHDVLEFAQLVSTNPYILPMAKLEEKGTYFNSPIIIVTSNIPFGSSFNVSKESIVVDNYAIWRRFHFPIHLKKEGSHVSYREIILEQIDNQIDRYNVDEVLNYPRQVFYEDSYLPKKDKSIVDYRLEKQTCPLDFNVSRDYMTFSNIMEKCITSIQNRNAHHNCYLTGYWTQNVGSISIAHSVKKGKYDYELHEGSCDLGQGLHTYINFPLHPPDDLPKCKVVALAEPLKVRVITAGESNLKCLQNLQKTLWSGLRMYPQFSLTHGISHVESEELDSIQIFDKMEKEINRIYSHDDNHLWLSGDYTAATDNLPMWVTHALMEGILENIDHEPTKEWARYEIGQHELIYPKNYNIPNGVQTSGQLMGSLLSFPLLCLANAFIVEYSGISPKNYLVNGDDIVAHTSSEAIQNWKRNAPRIGLSLSLGKNFVSPSFCTVNSQLFCYTELLDKMTFKCTGKVSLLRRGESKVIGDTYRDFQRLYGIEDIYRNVFVSNNYSLLQSTPCSLQVPRTHGGLGDKFVNGITINQKLAKTVYFAELDKRLRQKPEKSFMDFTDGLVPVLSPYWASEKSDILPDKEEIIANKVRSLCLPKVHLDETLYEREEQIVPELSNREYRKFEKTLGGINSFLKCIIDNPKFKISHFPSLKSLKFQTHFIKCEDYEKVSSYLYDSFISMFVTRLKDDLDLESYTWYNEELEVGAIEAYYTCEEEEEFLSESHSQATKFLESIEGLEEEFSTSHSLWTLTHLSLGLLASEYCPRVVDYSNIVHDDRFLVLDNNQWFNEKDFCQTLELDDPIPLPGFD